LRKEPERRIGHMDDVKVALEDLRNELRSGPIEAVAINPPRRVRLWPWMAGAALTVAALALGAAAGRNLWKEPAEPELVFSRLTYDPGLTTSPTLSRDGNMVAYTSDRDGGPLKLWVQHVKGGQAIRLTSGDWDDSTPSFSPDASQIVYRSEKDNGGVYVISALGGEPRLIAPNGRNPHFSPYGKQIAYWEGDWGTGLPASVYVTAASGGQPRRILAQFEGARYPIWSPDGEIVLFAGVPKLKDWQKEYGLYRAPVEGAGSATAVLIDPRFGSPGLTIDWAAMDQTILDLIGQGTIDIYSLRVPSNPGRDMPIIRRLTAGGG
jgi:dipeptidyl aminopeptidase/acylaminoacyl peptidase